MVQCSKFPAFWKKRNRCGILYIDQCVMGENKENINCSLCGIALKFEPRHKLFPSSKLSGNSSCLGLNEELFHTKP